MVIGGLVTAVLGLCGVIVKMGVHAQALNGQIAEGKQLAISMAEKCGLEKENLLRERLAAETKLHEKGKAELKELSQQLQVVLTHTNRTLDGIVDASRGSPDAE